MRNRLLAALVVSALCVGVPGCALFRAEEPRQIVVSESPLNSLEVRCAPDAGKKPVRLSLQGTGHILVRTGSSPQIDNHFSQDVASAKWHDLREDQLTISPEQMRDIFQALVDRGLLREPDKDFLALAAADRDIPVAQITGRLNNTAVTRLAVEPELAGYLRELLRLFEANRLIEEATGK